MISSTKELVLNYMSDLTQGFDFTQVKHFTAKSISDEMHISRSLASQYLNELVKEKLIIKINSRPVYFLHRKKMEEIFKIVFQEDDFYDLQEVKQFIKEHSVGEGDYSKIIGHDKSLSSVIKSSREGFEYPPSGLPVLLYGQKGTGKRTISRSIYENAARKGKIEGNTQLFQLEFTSSNQIEIELKVFGSKDKSGIIDKYDNIVFIFSGIQHMSQRFQDKLCQLMEKDSDYINHKTKYKKKIIRYIFISDHLPNLSLNERLLKNIPIVVQLPTLNEKSKEEREELIIYFIQNEGNKMNKKIKISSSVLRALVNGDYENNIIGLKSSIQIMCASALKDGRGKDEIIIHTYNLPEHLLKTLPIVMDENLIYIDTSEYKKSEEIDFILDYFGLIIKPFSHFDDFQEALREGKRSINLLNDFFSYKQRISPDKIKGIEISLSNIIDTVLKKRYINLPSGLSGILAKLIYINDLYAFSIEKWEHDHFNEIDEIMKLMKENCMYEIVVIDELIRLMNANLEIKINDLMAIMMLIYLNHYNSNRINQKIFGMIVCHGYSTATSIAEAVNSLLDNYIFDAVDMPLDITIDEIKEVIVERINHLHSNADVIVMVDMGSLEHLGKGLSSAINCNVGVINNVSTRLALNVANEILNEKDMRTILQEVSDDSKANYTIIERKKKDAIVFTSESGIHMAQRMRELFENSIPIQIPIDLVVCDYNQLIVSGNKHEIFDTHNVSFITGTSTPHIEGHTFIALEDIITGKNVDVIIRSLSKYLNDKELGSLFDELRKNFTLQNVVGYLTILNPKVLLDNVSMAVDVLQDYMQRRFSGKTLIGIYIHVCCLIERLVTKSAITEFNDLENFEKINKEFIQYIYDSFHNISKRYNITIPTSEIAYLYEFIEADSQNDNEENNEED